MVKLESVKEAAQEDATQSFDPPGFENSLGPPGLEEGGPPGLASASPPGLAGPAGPPGLAGRTEGSDEESESESESESSEEEEEKEGEVEPPISVQDERNVFYTFDPFTVGSGVSHTSTLDVFRTFDPWGTNAAVTGPGAPGFDAFGASASALNDALAANAAALEANARALEILNEGHLPKKPPGANSGAAPEMPPGMQVPLWPGLPYPPYMFWGGGGWPAGSGDAAWGATGGVQRLPKKTKAAKAQAQKGGESAPKPAEKSIVSDEGFSTVMLRQLPKDLNRDTLLCLLDEQGFKEKYNFVYMPTDFKTWHTLSYAFVNLITPADAKAVTQSFQGYKWPGENSKVCDVKWCDHQGLDVLLERFRNSPVMHETVPDLAKPVMFENGELAEFPPPTKTIKPPRCQSYEKRANHLPRRQG